MKSTGQISKDETKIIQKLLLEIGYLEFACIDDLSQVYSISFNNAADASSNTVSVIPKALS
jgi:hypothetical protein